MADSGFGDLGSGARIASFQQVVPGFKQVSCVGLAVLGPDLHSPAVIGSGSLMGELLYLLRPMSLAFLRDLVSRPAVNKEPFWSQRHR